LPSIKKESRARPFDSAPLAADSEISLCQRKSENNKLSPFSKDLITTKHVRSSNFKRYLSNCRVLEKSGSFEKGLSINWRDRRALHLLSKSLRRAHFSSPKFKDVLSVARGINWFYLLLADSEIQLEFLFRYCCVC